ncbi:unnamed protein product [Alopecurus aequalis]
MATNELLIKLLFDTKTDKLCFAEAGSDVVDFLSGLLSLPLGTVANLLTKERMAGSIVNVVGSTEKLDTNYKSKEGRLSPAVAPATLSRLQQLLGSHLSNSNGNGNGNSHLFTCEGPHTLSVFSSTIDRRVSCGYLSATSGTACPICKSPMHKQMFTMLPPNAGSNGAKVVAAAAAAPTTYIVRDDLSVTPASNVLSGITLLAQCGVKDISTLQEKTVKIGTEETLAILAASLKSKTVLTDVFLPKKNARCKREPPEED